MHVGKSLFQRLVMTDTDLCHGLHFYADVLLQLTSTESPGSIRVTSLG